MRRIKSVIFDLDGTLLDSINTIYQSIYKSIKELNLPPLSREQIKKNIHTSTEGAFMNVYPNHFHLLERAKDSFSKNYMKTFKDTTKEIPGAISTLKKLRKKGIKIGIITTKTKFLAVRMLKYFRIPHDVLLAYEDTVETRPDPEPLKKAMSYLNSSPTETVYVGDTPQDIKQGKNARVITVAVSSGLHSKKELAKENPDFLIENVSKIPESIWEA